MGTQNTSSKKKKKIDNVSDIPSQQIKRMQQRVRELANQHPSWTPEMVGKQVAEEFNIKVKYGTRRRG